MTEPMNSNFRKREGGILPIDGAHKDCIGSEFNYRSEMKCPNCRVVENGEWLIPDEVLDDDEEYSMHITSNNPRVELHIHSHGGRVHSSTSRDQNGSQDSRSPPIAPTVHYHHHNTIMLPPNYGGNAVVYNGLSADTLQRAHATPQGSEPGRRARVDHVVLPDRPTPRPNVGGDTRAPHQNPPYYQHNSPTPTVDTTPILNQRRDENTMVQTNMAGHDSTLSYDLYNDPSLELTLTTNPSESRSNEELQGTHESDHSANGTSEGFWFPPLQ
ncbi:RING/U-box superfamily protein [Perilla frutescens var. frutescens]|nr:RING/U-box superfamily protein [Perilla frutescens var. frutescens]